MYKRQLLNFTVPFALVFFQSDQFAPKGYFGYAMTFVFLELRPPTPEEFPVQMLCLLFCTLVLIGALLLYACLLYTSYCFDENGRFTEIRDVVENDVYPVHG